MPSGGTGGRVESTFVTGRVSLFARTDKARLRLAELATQQARVVSICRRFGTCNFEFWEFYSLQHPHPGGSQPGTAAPRFGISSLTFSSLAPRFCMQANLPRLVVGQGPAGEARSEGGVLVADAREGRVQRSGSSSRSAKRIQDEKRADYEERIKRARIEGWAEGRADMGRKKTVGEDFMQIGSTSAEAPQARPRVPSGL